MMVDGVLDRTLSLCPECVRTVRAEIRAAAGGVVVMDKTCPEHGRFVTVIANSQATYERLCSAPRKVTHPALYASERAAGCPSDCGLCTAHDQHTCMAIMEITSRCDLGCPVCLAAARPEGTDLPPARVEYALRELVRTEGDVTPLQLSGGEPTQHPGLADIVRRARAVGFRKIEIASNGLALAADPDLAGRLRDAGLTGIYLQMDTVRPVASAAIRGRDLVEDKRVAIERCRQAGLGVVLSVTVVPGANEAELWEMVRFGMAERLTGVNFQPVVLSGRYPRLLVDRRRFTLAHFLEAMEAQSRGALRAADLVPIPCPDTRCGVMAYALVRGGTLLPLSRVLTPEQLFEPMADMSDWDALLRRVPRPETAGCCPGGECGPLVQLGGPPGPTDYFAVGCHEMMDAYNFDYERAKRCCVHELTPEGKLIPFCLYSIKYRRPAAQPEKEATCRP